MSERPKSQRETGLIGAVEVLATNVGHLGYGLLYLPLQLLPIQTRTHVHNAIRELSYGFASLPRDFAEIASQGIEAWAQKDEPEDVLMAAPSLPPRGVEVRSTPAERDLGATRRVGLITMPIAPPMAPLGGGMQHFGSSTPMPLSEGLVITPLEDNPLGNDSKGK